MLNYIVEYLEAYEKRFYFAFVLIFPGLNFPNSLPQLSINLTLKHYISSQQSSLARTLPRKLPFQPNLLTLLDIFLHYGKERGHTSNGNATVLFESEDQEGGLDQEILDQLERA